MQGARWCPVVARVAAGSMLALPLVGCGGAVSEAPGIIPDAGQAGVSGNVAVQLALPAGVVIANAAYTLTGPNAFHRWAMVDVPDVRDIAFGIDNLPATNGYNLDISLTAPDGTTVCDSSGQFGVAEMTTTTLVLIPHCSDVPPPPSTSALQLTVDLPTGVSIATLAFSLLGANGFRMQDAWSVANDSALLFVVQNLPAGMGDAIALSAMSSDGSQACVGSTTISFEPNATTTATIVLHCQGVSGGADP